MAEAMLAGLLGQGLVDARLVVCSHPRGGRREELERAYGVRTTDENSAAAHEADILLLAVKPQMLAGVADELRGTLPPDQLVISIIAGASTMALGDGLDQRGIVRAMPDTAGRIGAGLEGGDANDMG